MLYISKFNAINNVFIKGNYKSQVMTMKIEQVKPEYFVSSVINETHLEPEEN